MARDRGLWRRAFRAAVLTGVCLAPFAAEAQDFDIGNTEAAPPPAPPPVYNNEIDVGARWQNLNSFRYGRYNGYPDSGGYFTGGFHLLQSQPWDSEDTRYWEAGGSELNLSSDHPLPNSSLYFKGGQRGSWSVGAFMDRTAWYGSDSFQTIYNPNGTFRNPGLIPGNLAGSQTGPASAAGENNSAALAGFLTNSPTSLQRTKFGGNAFIQLAPDWTFTGQMEHEHKEGTQEQSMLFGSGKNAQAQGYNGTNAAWAGLGAPPVANSGNLVYFPQPINYDTDRYTATLGYTRPQLQAQLAYTLQVFTDNNSSVNLVDPFPSTAIGTGGPASSATSGNNLGSAGIIQGAYALPPSNMTNMVKGLFAYNLNPTTRINANASYGVTQQTDGFVAMTLNPNTTAVPHLPASNFDGKMESAFGNLAITTSPIRPLELRASYTIDSRANKSPQEQITFIENDRAATSSAQWTTLNNAPYSFLSQLAKIEATYRILPQTKGTLGYSYGDQQESFVDSNHFYENTYMAKVNTHLFDGIDGMIRYTHADRQMENYNGLSGWLALGHPENQTNLVDYSYASRKRDEVKTMLTASPIEQVSVGLNASWVNNSYPETPVGMTNNHYFDVGPDIAYQPTKDITAHFFYDYEVIFYDNRGLSAPSTPVSGTNPIWSNGTTNTVHTAGVEGTWQVSDRWKLGAMDNFSYGNTSFNIADGLGFIPSTLTSGSQLASQLLYQIVPLQDVKSTLNTFQVHAEWQFRPGTTLWLGYTFERFISNDYTWNVAPTTYGNALLPGDTNPSYSAHVVGVSVHYKW